MNEKWFSCPILEIEKKLNTNAASGLPRKAARYRLKKSGRNDFFYLSETSAAECIKRVFSDSMLLLMVAVDIIAAVFGSVATAITCGVMIALNISAAVFSYIKACRVAESMAEYSQPRVKVIRDGKLFYADSRALVRGDIVLLEAGDLVPCDLRLISSHELTVSVYCGERGEEFTAEKNTESVYGPDSVNSPLECKNMVHAGSHIIKGSARAVVVETGRHTYIGALDGGIPLNHTAGSLGAIKKLRKTSKAYGFILMAAILPLTVIGILSFGAEHLLDTFMLIMAISVSALGELIYVLGGVIVSAGLTELALDDNAPAIVKNIESLDKIAAPDYIFLLDDAALTDGTFRISRLLIGDRSYEGKEIFTKDATRFFDLVMMTEHARRLSPTLGASAVRPIFDAASYFGERIGIDKNSFAIKVKNSTFYPSDAMHTAECASLLSFGERVCTFVSTNSGLIEKCAFIRIGGVPVTLDANTRAVLIAEAKRMTDDGCALMICASSGASQSARPAENGLTLEGVAAFLKNKAPEVDKCRSELERLGMRIIAFVDSEDRTKAIETAKLLGGNKLPRIAFASESRWRLADIIDGYRVFAGFTPSSIKDAVEKLRANGKTVAIAGINGSQLEIFEFSDATISYGVSKYRTSGIDVTELETSASVDMSAQTLRFSADSLIKRAGKRSGGLCSIYSMIRVARGIHINLESVLTYLLCTQAARVIIAAFATLFSGISLLTPGHLLFGGLIVDFFAAIEFSLDTHSLTERTFFDYSPKNIIKRIKTPMISVIAASVITSAAALVTAILTESDVSRAVFVSITLMQTLIFLLIRYKENVKNLLSPLAVAVMIASAVGSTLISLITPISALFGAGIASAWSLLIVPIAPIVFCIAYLILKPRKKA